MNNISLFSNNTELYWTYRNEETDEPTVLIYVNKVTILLVGIFAIGMLLNLSSIVAIIRTKKLEPITLLILNLALGDIVYISGLLSKLNKTIEKTLMC